MLKRIPNTFAGIATSLFRPQAPVPSRAFEKTRFDDHLIAGLAVSKFADYMPNYRQEQILKRSGIKLHRSTIGRLMDQAVDALLPLYGVLNDDLKSSSKLLMDETTLAQLMPGTGKTKTCFVWALSRDDRRRKGNAHPAFAFHFEQSRKGEHAEEILDGFKGTLQVDGYAGYNRLTRDSRDGGPLTLAYCWAHVRRKFLDVHKATKSDKAHQVFTLINDIYAIEHDLKGRPADVCRAVRQLESGPLVAQLHLLLLRFSSEISMKSTLGQAISYTMKLWDGLLVFLSDGVSRWRTMPLRTPFDQSRYCVRTRSLRDLKSVGAILRRSISELSADYEYAARLETPDVVGCPVSFSC